MSRNNKAISNFYFVYTWAFSVTIPPSIPSPAPALSDPSLLLRPKLTLLALRDPDLFPAPVFSASSGTGVITGIGDIGVGGVGSDIGVRLIFGSYSVRLLVYLDIRQTRDTSRDVRLNSRSVNRYIFIHLCGFFCLIWVFALS